MEKNGSTTLIILTFAAGVAVGALVVQSLAQGKQPTLPPPATPLFRELLCATVSGVASAFTTKALA